MPIDFDTDAFCGKCHGVLAKQCFRIANFNCRTDFSNSALFLFFQGRIDRLRVSILSIEQHCAYTLS